MNCLIQTVTQTLFDQDRITWEQKMLIDLCVMNTDPDELVSSSVPIWEGLVEERT